MQLPSLAVTLVLTGFTTLAGTTAIAQERPQAEPAGMPGSSRDTHGCITSAGYVWCAHSQQCERPWELAQEQGFAATKEAFEQYCGDSGQN